MASELFSGFSGFAKVLGYVKLAGWFMIFLIIALIISALVLFIVVHIKSIKIQELSIVNRSLKSMTGRFKKNKNGVKMLWVRRLKKFIPKIQEEDVYHDGKKETIILVKDQNGLHHTARLPSYEEILEWFKKVYGVDLETAQGYEKIKENLHTIYLLPNPSEDLDWLGNQAIEANKEFVQSWWQSPAFVWGTTIAICAFTFIITLMIAKKI